MRLPGTYQERFQGDSDDAIVDGDEDDDDGDDDDGGDDDVVDSFLMSHEKHRTSSLCHIQPKGGAVRYWFLGTVLREGESGPATSKRTRWAAQNLSWMLRDGANDHQ